LSRLCRPGLAFLTSESRQVNGLWTTGVSLVSRGLHPTGLRTTGLHRTGLHRTGLRAAGLYLVVAPVDDGRAMSGTVRRWLCGYIAVELAGLALDRHVAIQRGVNTLANALVNSFAIITIPGAIPRMAAPVTTVAAVMASPVTTIVPATMVIIPVVVIPVIVAPPVISVWVRVIVWVGEAVERLIPGRVVIRAVIGWIPPPAPIKSE